MLRRSLWSVVLVCAVVATVALAHFAAELTGITSVGWGIQPRSAEHWHTVFLAPFVHANTTHLWSNAAGVIVFGSLVAVRSKNLFLFGSLFIIVVGGALVWAFGRSAWHIGASGWVYGLWALTISLAWFDRNLWNIIVALVVLTIYGGMGVGMLPLQAHISFEMHVAGVVAGVACAYLYAQVVGGMKRARVREKV